MKRKGKVKTAFCRTNGSKEKLIHLQFSKHNREQFFSVES